MADQGDGESVVGPGSRSLHPPSAVRLRCHPPSCSPPPQVCTKAPAQQQYSSQNLTEVVHCFIALGEAPRIGGRGRVGGGPLPSPRLSGRDDSGPSARSPLLPQRADEVLPQPDGDEQGGRPRGDADPDQGSGERRW